LRLTRPVPGTGGGEGASANCASFRYAENSLRGLSPQLEIDNGRWGRLKTFFNNVITGGESQVFERRDVSDDAVFVCSDTPPGTYEINGAILDGRGGKQEFELTVEITEAQVAGGSAEWSMTSTSDSDGDGVPDDDDAFPNDPAASLDTDGDGYPDAWNPSATQEQIDASGLTLDELPNEPWYWRDNDGDGIAASQDADDYDPYSAYVLVEDFIEDMRTEDPTDLLTDVYVQFETMGGANPIFSGGQLTLESLGHIESNPPAGFITSQTYSGDTYFYSRIGRSTEDGSYNVGLRVGQNALVFHPGLSDSIQGHFRHEYAAEGSDDFALNIAGPNIDMGFTPAVGVLHPVEVRINAATGDARVTITDANNADNVFQYDFNDPRLATGSYRLGFLTHGNPGLGVGYFDSVRIANRTYLQLSDGSLGVANLAGAFGGATWEEDVYTFPSGAETWAGFANLNTAIYPFTFETGGYIEFVASVPSGGSVDVRFRLEYLPYPDVDPSYDTESITISGSDPQLYRAEIPPLGANTYESFLLYVDTLDVPVLIPQVEVVQQVPVTTSEIRGSYLVSTNTGSFGVGPAEFDTQWWNNGAQVNEERACFFDDEYIFGADGTFHQDLRSETWLEGWQGGSDNCASPVNPYDGSAIASFVYDDASNTLGIGGKGAYVGVPKAVNGKELVSLTDIPDSVVYNAYLNFDGSINVSIESGGFWWNYLLVPKGGLNPVADDTDGDGVPDDQDAFPNDPAASVDSDGDGYPDYWNAAASELLISESDLTIDMFPTDSTEWIDTDGDGVGNNADDDDDNDGIPDVDDLFPLVKAVAFDEDYDGIADSIDAFPQISSRGFVDTDFDGAPDDCDTSCQDLGMAADDDDDGDGILDVNDPEPLVTPDGVYQTLPILNRGVAGPEWTVGIIGVSEADPGVDVCVADEGASCSNIDWRFAEDPERQTVLEVEHNINTPLGWAFLEIAKSKGSNETLNLEEYRSATLSMEIRLLAPSPGTVDFNTYANCLYPCGGSANDFEVQAGAWQTIEIPVNELVRGGLDLSAVNIGFGLNPLVEQSNGVIYQVDNVRWSLRAPNLSDSDRDGLTDQYEIDEGLDPFSADTDADGVSDPDELTRGTDPLNRDTDGDGATDGFDAFPLDSTEFSDADGDGVGDIADNDDDNDGIDDGADLFPLHDVDSAFIQADLTDANLPFGLVTYLPGADSDPAVRLGVLPQAWTLFADGSYKTNYQPNTGSWSQLAGGYVLSRETDTRVVTVTNDLQNLNWASESIAMGNQLEVRVVSETRLAVIEQGDEIWRLVIWGESFEYAIDDSITLDPTAPIRTYRGASVTEQTVVSPTASFEPFTPVDLLGSWAISAVNQADTAAVDYCLTNASGCADIINFAADNTAVAEVSGRSLAWSLSAEGFLDLTFNDTGTPVRIRRLSSANDTSVALISIDTFDTHINHLAMIVKRSAPAPTSIDGFFGGMLSSAFYVTSDDEEYAHRSSIDGGLIDNFGFVLNEGGTGQRVGIDDNYYQARDLTWSLVDSRLTSETCLAIVQIDNEDLCYYKQVRSWDLLKKTSDRIYVHETLTALADFDFDGVFDAQSSESRNNFWELTSYYDLNDFDRDGYVNADDAFPTDETEWLDSDGDGIGDNSDPDTDTDGDGLPNGQDGDDDNDGLSDDDESLAGTDPLNRDSDGDGTTDG
ncbi:MAG: hypothetical protein L7S45_07985, partial [Luminiphilus sp.]|nr:hypothetical protein [Luminiphilus sp.]